MITLIDKVIFCLVCSLVLSVSGCAGPAGIASAGSNAVTAITDDLNQAHVALAHLPADAKTADAHVTDAKRHLPAVAAMPGEILKLSTQWENSWFAGKFWRWFWTIVIVAIIAFVVLVLLDALRSASPPLGPIGSGLFTAVLTIVTSGLNWIWTAIEWVNDKLVADVESWFAKKPLQSTVFEVREPRP